MSSAEQTQTEMLGAIPNLRAFAVLICRNADHADRLVEDTVLRAMADADNFQPGEDLQVRLFQQLRTIFHGWRYRPAAPSRDASNPAQQAGCRERLHEAMQKLPAYHREALVLIAAAGFSYQDAAVICACTVGTIKSRVAQARSRLARLMFDGDLQHAATETDMHGLFMRRRIGEHR